MSVATAILNPSNDAEEIISLEQPYVVKVGIEGVAPFLFHRWSIEGVKEKAGAAKGSRAKKQDNIENYVYRNESGDLCIPSEHLRMAAVLAAKFKQDPRSPRKSAMDLFKAAIVPLEELNSLGTSNWDYVDQRRVTIQRNGITRERPAMQKGWKIETLLMCNLPEYIQPSLLNEVIQMAGKLCGLGDFRPTFGRFVVNRFELV